MEDTNLDQLVEVYIKIRDAKSEAAKKAAEVEAEFDAQLDTLEQHMLEACKATGASSIKTPHGTIMQSVKTRYWTNDWEKFYQFMFENHVPELLEKRIQQTNMKQFLEENPDVLPQGLNVDREHSITVRRSK